MDYATFAEYLPEIRRVLIERIQNAQTPSDLFAVISGISKIFEQAKQLRARDDALSA